MKSLLGQGAENSGGEEPDQAGGAGAQAFVYFQGSDADFAKLDLHVARVRGQQVRRQLVHAWLVATSATAPADA